SRSGGPMRCRVRTEPRRLAPPARGRQALQSGSSGGAFGRQCSGFSTLALVFRRMPRPPMYLALALAATLAAPAASQVSVTSPDGRNQVTLSVREGHLYYTLARDGRALIDPSIPGFSFKKASPLAGALRLPATH